MSNGGVTANGSASSEWKVAVIAPVLLGLMEKFQDQLGIDYMEPSLIWGVAVMVSAYVLGRSAVKVARELAGKAKEETE